MNTNANMNSLILLNSFTCAASYDIITVVGSHGVNHIESEALYEIIRLTKPGMYILAPIITVIITVKSIPSTVKSNYSQIMLVNSNVNLVLSD